MYLRIGSTEIYSGGRGKEGVGLPVGGRTKGRERKKKRVRSSDGKEWEGNEGERIGIGREGKGRGGRGRGGKESGKIFVVQPRMQNKHERKHANSP